MSEILNDIYNLIEETRLEPISPYMKGVKPSRGMFRGLRMIGHVFNKHGALAAADVAAQKVGKIFRRSAGVQRQGVNAKDLSPEAVAARAKMKERNDLRDEFAANKAINEPIIKDKNSTPAQKDSAAQSISDKEKDVMTKLRDGGVTAAGKREGVTLGRNIRRVAGAATIAAGGYGGYKLWDKVTGSNSDKPPPTK